MGISGKTWKKRDILWELMAGRFMGTYHRALDAKGRFLLPPRFLDVIGADSDSGRGSFWLTSLYGRITAYLPAAWEGMVEQICRIRIPSQKLSNFKTKLIGMAEELCPDSQGRIRIPQSLMREGGLQREIVLVGILDKFEIWDQERFDAIPNEDVTEELAASGVDITL